MIEAKIILDSVNPAGSRLTTWLLTYPRFIHSEFMTHRQFSRNAASSRAIPIAKMMEAVRENPAEFEYYGANQKGMQAEQQLELEERAACELEIERLKGNALSTVFNLDEIGLHKQNTNRYLEPWMHMTVLATATDHSNFFKLRAHPAAQPEFQVLAYRMLSAYLASTPYPLEWEEWHLPGVDLDAADSFSISQKLKICVALACRASYSAFEDGISHDDAERIHDRGVEFGHWSPFEHAAQAIDDEKPGRFLSYPWSNFDYPGDGGPSGWGQYRKLFETECAKRSTPEQLTAILDARPEWVKV